LHYANDAKTFLKHLATVYFISAPHVRTALRLCAVDSLFTVCSS